MTVTGRHEDEMTEQAAAQTDAPTQKPIGPWGLAWRKLRKHRMAIWAGRVLILLYAIMLFDGFFAPHNYDSQDRDRAYHPPKEDRYADRCRTLHGLAPAHVEPIRKGVRHLCAKHPWAVPAKVPDPFSDGLPSAVFPVCAVCHHCKGSMRFGNT